MRTSDLYIPRTLAYDLKQRGCLPFEECLRIGLALTSALAHLHKNGLVHRDIKPSNIIFVNDSPKLADIGLVAEAADAPSYVGTEGFIPPEGPGTLQADSYSLGKVLYEIATGKDRHDYPELPTKLDETVNQAELIELNEIILTACRADARQRYPSAEQTHADLLFVAKRPIDQTGSQTGKAFGPGHADRHCHRRGGIAGRGRLHRFGKANPTCAARGNSGGRERSQSSG